MFRQTTLSRGHSCYAACELYINMSWCWRAILFAVLVVLALLETKDSRLFNSRKHSLQWRFEGTRTNMLASGSPMSAHVLTTVQTVLSTPTGPEDFAAMGNAVNLTLSLLDVAANSNMKPSENSRLTRHLGSALLHLFPFVKPCYEQLLSGLQTRAHMKRGIVIPCGNTNFQFALHLIAAVRNVFNSSLPIEVMYAGEHDLDEDRRRALQSVGEHITTVDISDFFDEEIAGLQGAGWAIKPFAVLASSFQQIIMADADVTFLQPPDSMFHHPGLDATGTLFFHDRFISGGNDVHLWWQGLMHGKQPSTMLNQSMFWAGKTSNEMESGVIAVDKGSSQILLGLLFAAWMNTKDIREKATYIHTYGDKESYWMAFELAGIPYYFDIAYASALGHATEEASGDIRLCPGGGHMHILHLDHTGKPLWYNASLFRDKYAPKSLKEWIHPEVWAADTGKWVINIANDCMLLVEPRAMSEGELDKLQQVLVNEATERDLEFDDLIM